MEDEGDYSPPRESENEEEEGSDFEITSTKKKSTPKKKSPARPRKRAKKEVVPKTEGDTTVDIEDLLKNKDFESVEQISLIREALLKWYDANQRNLPWRTKAKTNEERRKKDTRDEADEEATNNVGYAVWVSEIMLQQTRVETVIAYFNKWIARWPTIQSLAEASLEEVNEAWAGLGYYRRARFLHQGAKLLMEKHNGILPRTVEGLKSIPGIGEYTAGAIASIAFGQVTPLVDGNVIRVLARLRAIGADPKNNKTIKLYWKLAGDLVDPTRPGCFNQSLMELGATVCTAQQPKCGGCPVSSCCAAFAEGADTKYPPKVQKAKQREETVSVCVVQRGGSSMKGDRIKDKASFLLVQRPASGLLASFWEFPTVSVPTEPTLKERREKMAEYLRESVGMVVKVGVQGEEGGVTLDSEAMQKRMVYMGETTHLFSHIRQTLVVDYLYLGAKDEVSLKEIVEEMEEGEKEKKEKEKESKGKKRKRQEKKKNEKEKEKEKQGTEDKLKMRWLDEEELKNAAIAKGMKKCFELVSKWRGKTEKQQKAESDKKADTGVEGNGKQKKQASLESFFGAKKKK